MKKEQRTLTLEECEATALMLGMVYSVTVHGYYKKGDGGSWVCAETMKPLKSEFKRNQRRDEYHGRDNHFAEHLQERIKRYHRR